MSEKKSWYLPDRNGDLEPLGPFSTEDIVRKIRAGEVRTDEYICGDHFDDMRWERISDQPEFENFMVSRPKMPLPKKRSKGQQLRAKFDFSKEGTYGRRNQYRRFPRVEIDANVMIHNQHQLVTGRSIDMSERGVQVAVDSCDDFMIGDELFITIRNVEDIGTFSAVAVVMRKVEKEDQFSYGLYFLRVNPNIRRKIARYIITRLETKMKSNKDKVA